MQHDVRASLGRKGFDRLVVPALFGLMAVAALFGLSGRSAAEGAVALPPPVANATDGAASTQKVVLAGGCFWGVQAVFQHVKGVKEAVSGYAGGEKSTATYGQVSTGRTGHAESVEVTFDPHVVSFGTILQVYFSVAHNPTELNYQGPDSGTQYRSEIFYENDEQRHIAQAYIAQLEQARLFAAPIVTKVEQLKGFYPAEAYHQNYATLNPDSPYIAVNDLPKVANVNGLYADLYRPKPKLVGNAD
jgi:peptide-methionine (S)-S-oxide reductase